MRFARGVMVGLGGGGTALALALAVALGACGLDRPGGSSPIDASIDTGTDTGSDAGVDLGSDVALDVGLDVVTDEAGDASDGGGDANPCGDNYACGATGCATGINNCSACDAGHFACVGTASCVSDCTTCGGYTVTCCNANSSPNGVCQADTTGTACNGPLKHCPCNAGVSDCIANNQVCDQNDCLSCGETTTDGGACKDGGICSGSPLACR